MPQHEDGVCVWGVDGEGRAVYARIVLLSRHRAAVMLTITDSDGTVYTTPREWQLVTNLGIWSLVTGAGHWSQQLVTSLGNSSLVTAAGHYIVTSHGSF